MAGWIITAGAALVLVGSGQRMGEQFVHPLGFSLLDTSVAQVQAKWGPATVREVGHAEEAVCYLWPRTGTVVEITSSREGLSGAFTMREPRPAEPTCARLDPSTVAGRALEVGGLHLGMSRAAFRKRLGRLVRLEDGGEGATYEWSEPVPPNIAASVVGDRFYTIVTVSGRFMSDRLVEVSIWKTVST